MTTRETCPAQAGVSPMSKRTAIILSVVTVLLYAWAIAHHLSHPVTQPARFDYSITAPPQDSLPQFTREFISPELENNMAHVSSICQLKDGTLAATWLSGTREGAGDVAVMFSSRTPGHDSPWSEARVIADRESAEKELCRFVRKVGNPIIFTDKRDRLWLIYVTVGVGGWSGSSLNIKTSQDHGMTWSDSKKITLSPFLNMAELVKNNPLPLEGGGFAVPVYHELIGKLPELLWIFQDDEGRRIHFKKTRMAGGRKFFQPAVVPLSPSLLMSFYRTTYQDRVVGAAFSEDAGATWSETQKLELPNPNAAVNAIALSGGRILLAFNDNKDDRSNLRLAVSNDRGAHWTRVATLEDMADEEFSYPYMIRDKNGVIHMVYTWRKQRIRYTMFNESWLDEQIKKEVMR